MKIRLWALGWALTACHLSAAMIQEDFTGDPAARGWAVSGDAALFSWESASESLTVQWDSSQPNSYFYKRLGTVLTKSDDVQLAFDLQLDSIAAGSDPSQPFSFELAIGLINLGEASGTNFLRGLGTQSPDLLEFDYFPDTGFGATISPAIVSSNNQFMSSFTFPVELTVEDRFHVEMRYSATNQTLTTVMQRNGQPFAPIKDVVLAANFTDFRLDAFSISSYSDQGAGGSIQAHGRVDNLVAVFPDPPSPRLQGALVDGHWQVSFESRTNWLYTLERTEDCRQWRAATPAMPGRGAVQVLEDELQLAPPGQAFYRVRADRP